MNKTITHIAKVVKQIDYQNIQPEQPARPNTSPPRTKEDTLLSNIPVVSPLTIVTIYIYLMQHTVAE